MIRWLLYLLASIFLISVVRTIIGVVLKGFAELMGGGDASRQSASSGPSQSVPVSGELRKDPVCGTYVATSTPHRVTAKGETLYFCSETCKSKFTA